MNKCPNCGMGKCEAIAKSSNSTEEAFREMVKQVSGNTIKTLLVEAGVYKEPITIGEAKILARETIEKWREAK